MDITLLILLGLAAYLGWQTGFVRQVVSFLGFVLALVLAWKCYEPFGSFFLSWTDLGKWTVNAISFVLITLAGTILLTWLAVMATKAIDSLHLGSVNRLAGVAISVFKYGLLLGCIVKFLVFAGTISEDSMKKSWLAQPLSDVATATFKLVGIGGDKDTEERT